MTLKVLDLFSGIGGFSLGLERTGGFETVAFCEIEEFPRKVLNKHWPSVPVFEDVRELTKEVLDEQGIGPIDVITGGFPCQDLSVAGKQAGIGEGTRSGLFGEIIRLSSELRPSYIIMENVANLLSGPAEQRGGWFGEVLGELAAIGYDAEWENIPAAAMGAPHMRERVWIIAYPACEPRLQAVAKLHTIRGERNTRQGFSGGNWGKKPGRDWAIPQPVSLRMDHGLPDRMDRVVALGNSIIPQIPEIIGLAILDARSAA